MGKKTEKRNTDSQQVSPNTQSERNAPSTSTLGSSIVVSPLQEQKVDNRATTGNQTSHEKYTKFLSIQRLRPTTDRDRAKESTELERFSDKSRIVRSSPFRRLQTKAQVFSMARSGDVRTRLTHSIEVADYGELIAEALAQQLIKRRSLPSELHYAFIDIVENACLLHDIGNPPFGHMGEFAIQQWFTNKKDTLSRKWVGFKKITLTEAERHLEAYANFDGNPQGFRIITRLQWLNDEYGMNLTCSLLASYLKYLGDRVDSKRLFRKKVGYFPSEEDVIKRVWRSLELRADDEGCPMQRHPLSFLMEAADDIAFCLSDIEDALEKSVVTEADFTAWMRSRKSLHWKNAIDRAKEIKKEAIKNGNEPPLARNGTYHLFRLGLSKFLVKCAVDAYQQNEDRILDGSMDKSLLTTNQEARRLLDLQEEFCVRYVYSSREAISTELAGLSAITGLLNAYEPIMLLTTEEFEKLSDETNRNRLRQYPITSLLFTLLPEKHKKFYKWRSKGDRDREPIFRMQLIVDYISGMTDSHVLKIFNMINGTQQFPIE